MSNKMLVDAIHPEETRVVALRDKKVEDFDFEAATKRPLRGNIYLAKVTRVEPSLQAAFIEYGGNRHGFLAFSEIHPDYYQIPQADRQALIAEMEEEEPAETSRPKRTSRRKPSARKAQTQSAETQSPAGEAPADQADAADTEAADTDGEALANGSINEVPADRVEDAAPAAAETGTAAIDARQAGTPETETKTETDETAETDKVADKDAAVASTSDEPEATKAPKKPTRTRKPAKSRAKAKTADTSDSAPATADAQAASAVTETGTAATDGAGADDATQATDGDTAEKPAPKRRRRATTKKSDDGLADPTVSDDDDDAAEVTAIGETDALEEIPERRRNAPKRNYKIQEVIKRRQILLVQVVKEERGTKGAALTTYLSLAGRYSVLMPNTNRGGGVSRKITDNADRKRLKGLVSEFEVPEGMGIILRTAGASRTKTEIKRDFEYLLRLWESVRDLTLKSIAPELVYEEGNLVKRAIRDVYSKEIDEVLVSGEAAYREAKDFMKMLMPSHAKNVKPYREATPIFTAYGVEAQLDAMFSPTVMLPSKGSIVINPTEALVAIDVNSGRSTKESNIEDTATKTNLEAADEVARQLRLRDLAGLIVIDFIDMDDKRHNRQVEKRLKDALKLDRSRIQVGRISSFGLMEMSRQRIRQGMVETSMVSCPQCAGTGHVRSTQSVALYCLRALEEHLLNRSDNHVTIRTSSSVALYILNQKRAHLNALEERFGLEIGVHADEQLSGQHLEIHTGAPVERALGEAAPVAQLAPDAVVEDDDEDDVAVDETHTVEADDAGSNGRGSSRRRRRRRRRRGGADGADGSDNDDTGYVRGEAEDGEPLSAAAADDSGDDSPEGDGDGEDGRRSRRRRGRRGGRRHRREGEAVASADGENGAALTDSATAHSDNATAHDDLADGDDATPTGSAPITIEIAEGRPEDPSEPTEVAAPIDAKALGNGATPPQNGSGATGDASAETDVEVAAQVPDAEDDTATEPATEAPIEPAVAANAAPAAKPAPERKSENKTRRAGWWQRRSFF